MLATQQTCAITLRVKCSKSFGEKSSEDRDLVNMCDGAEVLNAGRELERMKKIKPRVQQPINTFSRGDMALPGALEEKQNLQNSIMT